MLMFSRAFGFLADDLVVPSSVESLQQNYQAAFVKTTVALVLLLGLVFATLWLYKKLAHTRLRAGNYMRNIKILERRPLSPKTILYLIETGGEQVLIAESQLEVRVIKQFGEPSPNPFAALKAENRERETAPVS